MILSSSGSVFVENYFSNVCGPKATFSTCQIIFVYPGIIDFPPSTTIGRE